MSILRSVMRVPMNMFNNYGAMPHKHPQLMNYYTVVGCMFVVTVMGRGAEKFSMWGYSPKAFREQFRQRQIKVDQQ